MFILHFIPLVSITIGNTARPACEPEVIGQAGPDAVLQCPPGQSFAAFVRQIRAEMGPAGKSIVVLTGDDALEAVRGLGDEGKASP